MRLCIMNSFMWKHGGAEVFCLEMIQALARRSEYELSVVCEKMPQSLATQLQDQNINVLETGLTWKGSGQTLRAAISWASLHILSRKITKALAKIKPDFLNPHNFPDVFYAARYKKRNKNVRISWFCHEPYRPFYDTEVLTRARAHERLFFTSYRYFFSPIYISHVQSFVDDIGVNSNYTASWTKKIYGKSPRVVYPGVNPSLFRRVYPNSKCISDPLILSPSSIDFSSKNSKIIPSVLSMLKKKYDVQWIHIGRGKDKSKLLNLARHFGVQDSLTIIDYVTQKDLVEYYSAANVVVYPSTREPFGLVPLESMACETPVITSKYGGTAETVVDSKTGFLVDMTSISEITCAISRILENERLARRMGRLGRQRVSKYFTWDRTIKDFLCLF